MTEGKLVVSDNRGRYAVNVPYGRDLTAGDVIEIHVGEVWIRGRVEHQAQLYAVGYLMPAQAGYVFYADNGSRCGLCVGMKVRLPEWEDRSAHVSNRR